MDEVKTEKGQIISKTSDAYQIKILSGDDNGKIIFATTDEKFEIINKDYQVGDTISLYVQNYDGEITYSVQDYWHLDSLVLWVFFFFSIIILIGKKQGLKSLISLILSVVLIFFVLIPLILKGIDPITSTLFISLIITIVTIFLITGNTKKSWVAILGTFFGVVFAYIFAHLITLTSHLDGIGSEPARAFVINFGNQFNLSGIFLSGIIIGALGAVMDVTISIASGLNEIKEHKKDITFSQLLVSGMNIGRDIMGGMVNTLIFAYIGASLILVLMTAMYNVPLIEFLNYGFISEEILRSLAGSIGLILSIPITAFFGAFILRKYPSSTV